MLEFLNCRILEPTSSLACGCDDIGAPSHYAGAKDSHSPPVVRRLLPAPVTLDAPPAAPPHPGIEPPPLRARSHDFR
jgi:hypothetical protein